MPVNADKVHLWKADVAQSVDFYNDWFMRFAPKTYRGTRVKTTLQVKSALDKTANLTDISPQTLKSAPAILPILRMVTAPPLARDRLIGLASVSPNLVKSMEIDGRLPPQLNDTALDSELAKIGRIIKRLTDQDLFPWLAGKQKPAAVDVERAATIVADRLCGAMADPIIRNAQEQRQLNALKHWLEGRGYIHLAHYKGKFNELPPGGFVFRLNIQVTQNNRARSINIPIDAVVMPLHAAAGELPLLIEAKSAGDYTNTNKRRKEEATKVAQLTGSYGAGVRFVLFLCGYFDSGYLGYEAAEGIDWVWEHRTDDLIEFGL
jgi:hypothetical protein